MQNEGIRLLGSFLNARRHLEQATCLENLSQGEFLVLRRIRLESSEEESKKITMFKAVKISEYLSMPAPAVSRILNSLEQRGFITRNINVNNRRSIVISLTDAGKSVLQESEKTVSSLASGLFSELGKEKTEMMIELLDKITNYCKNAKNNN